jgi:DNA (cytosine-5)-methyltransferase 1
MTIRESALIQTFPDDMEFAGKQSSQYRQIGDAVPPLLAEVMGNSLLDQLNCNEVDETKYSPPEARQLHFEAQ